MLRFPVKKIAITWDYNAQHPGVDFGWVDEGNKTIYASGKGKVIFAGTLSNGEKDILIYHPTEKCITIYGHLSKIYVKKGDIVEMGEEIGFMGNTNAVYVHLHYEIWKDAPIATPFPANLVANRAKYKTDPLLMTYCYDDQKVLQGSLKYGVKYIKGTPVERNTKVDQIEVLIDNLNCRNAPNGVVLGYAQKGIYNILSKEVEDYTWYEIEEDKWVAYDKSWAKIYTKEESELEKLKKENSILKVEKAALIKENLLLEDKLKQINKISS